MKYKIWLTLILTTALYLPNPLHAQTETIKNIWTRLNQTENQCPDIYDYHPQGGLRIFYCHLQTLLSLQDLQQMAGIQMFLSAPHQENQLIFDSNHEFAYYNPEFVQWLTANLIPAAEDPSFRQATQPLYNQYVQPLAQTYYATYQALQAQADYFQTETKHYAEMVTNHQLPQYYYENYYNFADLHQNGYDGNVVKSAVAFWIRRNIDTTLPLFILGLEKLLTTYDKPFLKQTKPVAAPKTLTDVWLNLEAIFLQTDTRCQTEHTWLPEYGMRGFYCHLKSGINIAQLQELANIPIFLSGPHSKKQLDLNARFSFGHYNPEFIKWLTKHILPDTPNAAFLKQTQPLYDTQMQSLARTYYLVYRLLYQDNALKTAEKARYQALIESGDLPEYYATNTYWELKAQFAELTEYAGIEFEVASAMTFWLRRLMDNTADEFSTALQKLMTTYDAEFLKQFPLTVK